MESIYQNLGGNIVMPEFKKRNLYMHKTSMNKIILPDQFKDYEKTVENIISKIKDRDNVCYITIDEKTIKGETHRRSGVHVDFNWYENLKGTGNGGHGGGQGSHKRVNAIGKWDDVQRPQWDKKELDGGGMLLVSNYEGCRVWKGKFDGEIGQGGCCKNINLENLENEIMPAGHVYFLNSLGIHESIYIDKEINRNLIRINFHPDYHFNN